MALFDITVETCTACNVPFLPVGVETHAAADDPQIGSTSTSLTSQTTAVPPKSSGGKPSIDNQHWPICGQSMANISEGAASPQKREPHDRFEAWDRGEAGYTRRDAFLNTQRKLDDSIKVCTSPMVPTPRESMSEKDY